MGLRREQNPRSTPGSYDRAKRRQIRRVNVSAACAQANRNGLERQFAPRGTGAGGRMSPVRGAPPRLVQPGFNCLVLLLSSQSRASCRHVDVTAGESAFSCNRQRVRDVAYPMHVFVRAERELRARRFSLADECRARDLKVRVDFNSDVVADGCLDHALHTFWSPQGAVLSFQTFR